MLVRPQTHKLPFTVTEATLYGVLIFGIVWVITTPGVMDAIIEAIDNIALKYVEGRGLLKTVEAHSVPIEKEEDHGSTSEGFSFHIE